MAQFDEFVRYFDRHIDPFWLAFLIGLLIILWFCQVRLDVPLGGSSSAGKTGNGPALGALFVHRLPPSSVRVKKFFRVACGLYFIGLSIFFTFLCLIVRIVLADDVADTAGAVAADLRLPELPGIDTSLFTVLQDSSVASDHPWHPVLVALGLVGILPVVPWVRIAERHVRQVSLRAAGIPRKVLGLWNNLRETPVPDAPEALPVSKQKLLEQSMKAFQRFGSTEQEDRQHFKSGVEKLLCFSEWVEDWPDENVQQSVRAGSDNDFSVEVKFFLDDLQHLVEISRVVDAAGRLSLPEVNGDVVTEAEGLELEVLSREGETTFGRPQDEQPEGTPSPPHAKIVQREESPESEAHTNEMLTSKDVKAARNVVRMRWQALYARIASKADQPQYMLEDTCCLHIAIYAERSRKIDDSAPKMKVLREWLKNARDPGGGKSILNFAIFALLLTAAAAFGCYWVSLHWGWLDGLDSSSNPKLAASFSLSIVLMLTPALVSLFLIRGLPPDDNDWVPWIQFFAPPMIQYLIYCTFVFVLCWVLQLAAIYVEPRIGGGELFPATELLQRERLEVAARRALPGATFALFLALAFDQKKRDLTRWRWIGAISFVVLGVAVAGGALLLIPEYQLGILDASTLPNPDRAFDTQFFQLLLVLGVALLLKLLLLLSYMRPFGMQDVVS